MDIKGTTRVCGLIGNPVGHSISPVIHNTLADITKTNMVYTTFKVDKEDVAKAVVAPTTKTNAKAQAKIEVFLNFIIASILSEIAFSPKWLEQFIPPLIR